MSARSAAGTRSPSSSSALSGFHAPRSPAYFQDSFPQVSVARLALLRHDVERPEQLAGADVEAAHIVARAFFLPAAVARAVGVAGHDDDVADDDRAGRVGELAGERLRRVEVQSDAAPFAEVG